MEAFSVDIEKTYLYRESGTSDGTQEKYYLDGFWYKVDKSGSEGLAEYLATLALDCSNLAPYEYVRYEQGFINGQEGCRSQNCLKMGEELVSFYRLWANTNGGDIAAVMQMMDYDDAIEKVVAFIREQTQLDIHRYLANNLAFAMFIRNEDLHFNNLWVRFDGDKFDYAPIMDNGRSMFVGNRRFDSSRGFDRNKRESFSRIFSASFDQNYHYLEKYSDIKFDRKKLIAALDKEPQSAQRDFIYYQIDSYPELMN